MRSTMWRTAVAVCGICFMLTAWAAEPAGSVLTLSAAIRQALDQRPELAAFAFDVRERQAAVEQARQRPAPELDLLLEDALGTGDHSGLKAAQATVQLSQVIELGGKRDARQAVADAGVRALDQERAIGQLDVVAEVARRFIEVLRGQARHAQAREALQLAEQTAASVQQRVTAARAPLAEAARAAAAVVNAQVRLDDTDHELLIARRHLAAAMGLREAGFGEATGELDKLTPVDPIEQLLADLERSPDLLQYADTTRVREAELRLAQLQARANLRASFGVRRLEQANDMALVAGVSLPLFAAQRARPQIEAGRARLERVQGERDAAYLRLQAQLYALHQELGHNHELAATLQDNLIPRLASALELTTQAYERGRYSYLELAGAQRELLDARARLLETQSDFQLLRIEIERLTARSLDAAGATP